MGHIPTDDERAAESEDGADGAGADENGETTGDHSRRGVLAVGAAALGAGALGSVGEVAGATTRNGITFDRVVDAVDDLGMDPNGNDPIDAALDAAYETGTLVEFPPGDYLVTDLHHWDDGKSRFGMVGTGSDHRDAQFVFPDGNNGEKFRMIKSTDGSHHVFANFSIQQTDDDTTSADMWIAHEDGTVIEDVEWLGRVPTDDYTRRQLLVLDCTTRSGVCVGRRLYMRDGAAIPGYPDGVMGIRISPSTYGEVRLEDCHIEQLGSSSFRATKVNGVLRVDGGLFKNNDNTNMRLSGGGHPDKDAWVRNAKVVVDADNLEQPTKDGDALEGPEGLRVDSSDEGYSGLTVRDTEIVYRSSPSTRGVVTCPTWGGHGGFTMKNCRVVNDTGVQTFDIPPVDTSIADQPYGMTLDNVTVTGAATSQPRGAAVSVSDDRNDTTIVDSCIHFADGDVDGVRIENADDCIVQNSNLNVTGSATDFVNSTVSTSGITYDGTCDDTSGGGGDDGSTDELAHTLTVEGTGTQTNYTFSVDEALERTGDLEEWDSVSGTSADGWITTEGSTDTFRFEANVTDFSFVEGDANVYIDGEAWDPSGGSDGGGSDGSTSQLSRTITVEGTGTQTNYTFSVGDALERTDDLEDWDSISGTSADGWVTDDGSTDTYRFEGALESFTFVEGDADVYVDGEPFDPLALELPNSLVVEATASETTSYEFSVTDQVVADSLTGPLESSDSIDKKAVAGEVAGDDVDAYRFSGNVARLTVNGDANLTFEDNDG